MSSNVPPEICREIFSYLCKDTVALDAVREASIAFALLSPSPTLVFKGIDHIRELFGPIPDSGNTTAEAIQCDGVRFKNSGTIDDDDMPKIRAQMGRIQIKNSLSFHVTEGGIPPTLIQLSDLWGKNVRELSISGGTHSPSAFFESLKTFPALSSLALKNFHIEEVGAANRLFKFPVTVARLSLSRCATLWTFLGAQVQPEGGLDGINDLYIQELFFDGKDGIPELRVCLQELHGVHTLTLDPVYDGRCPNFSCAPFSVYRRSWEATLLDMQGLKLLRLNCANVSPKMATESVCMYALQFEQLQVSAKANTVVEIYAPHSLDLSTPGACEKLLDAENVPNSASTRPGQSNLVLRGLPGRLPRDMGASQEVVVCGYPVAFKETDWEEAIGSRLDGL